MSYDLANAPRPLIVFEGDDVSLHGQRRLLAYLDNCLVLGKIKHPVETGLGAWEGKMNPCIVMDLAEFGALAPLRAFVEGQEAFIVVWTGGGADILQNNPKGAPFAVTALGTFRRAQMSELDAQAGFTMLSGGAFVADFN